MKHLGNKIVVKAQILFHLKLQFYYSTMLKLTIENGSNLNYRLQLMIEYDIICQNEICGVSLWSLKTKYFKQECN